MEIGAILRSARENVGSLLCDFRQFGICATSFSLSSFVENAAAAGILNRGTNLNKKNGIFDEIKRSRSNGIRPQRQNSNNCRSINFAPLKRHVESDRQGANAAKTKF